MKVLLKSVTGEGPEFNIDLTRVSRIEMHGQRASKAGWVRAVIKMADDPILLKVKLNPDEYDQLVTQWEGIRI